MAPRTAEQNAIIRDQRRTEILDAARAVYLQHGARGTEMRMVAEKAGVGKGTVYHYYPNKISLLKDLFETSLEESKRRLSKLTGEGKDPLDRLRRLCRGQIVTLLREPHLFRFFKNLFDEAAIVFGNSATEIIESYQESVGQPIAEIFREAEAQGFIVCRDLDRLQRLLWGAMIGAVTIYFEHSEHDQLEEIADDAVDLLICGIAVRSDEEVDRS